MTPLYINNVAPFNYSSYKGQHTVFRIRESYIGVRYGRQSVPSTTTKLVPRSSPCAVQVTVSILKFGMVVIDILTSMVWRLKLCTLFSLRYYVNRIIGTTAPRLLRQSKTKIGKKLNTIGQYMLKVHHAGEFCRQIFSESQYPKLPNATC